MKVLKKKDDSAPGRITNTTIDEHREAVLAQGRKFKYPFQYAKYKLVINTVIISIVVIIFTVVFGWLALYKWQNTSGIIFRITQILPLSVAEIDGQSVKYSDYLMRYRSNVTYIEQTEGDLSGTENGQRQLEYYKRVELDKSELQAYAIKLANENGISISNERIKEVFNEHRFSRGSEMSEENLVKTIREYYGLSRSEYERLIELSLITQEVQVKIDEKANRVKDALQTELSSDGSNFDTVASEHAEDVSIEASGGLVEAYNADGGRATKANELNVGQVSEPFISKSGDCYYIVKLLSKKDDKVDYISIKIPFTELQKRVDQLRQDGKIKEHITIQLD